MPQPLEPIIVKPLDHIAMPVQVVLQLVSPADGHVFTLTVDSVVYTFEFDSNSSVTAGRIAIPLGANDTATATNFVTTARLLMGDKIYFAPEGGYVDMLARHPEINFTGQILSGTSLIGPATVPQRSLPTILIACNREVYLADVSRGKMVALVPLDIVAVVGLVSHQQYQRSGCWLDWARQCREYRAYRVAQYGNDPVCYGQYSSTHSHRRPL